MMVRRFEQRTLYEAMSRAVIADHQQLCWEEWMVEVDRILEDEQLVEVVAGALARRWPQSRTRGRRGTPAEVVLRLLVLKHLRNWSYATLEREVRANLVYREFTRIGGEKVPDAKTMVRLGQALGPEAIRQIHERVVELGREARAVSGRKMRVDTTVVESNIRYPTDSGLLADGVRVMTRVARRLGKEMGRKVRSRLRSVAHRLVELGKAARAKGEAGRARREKIYRKLMSTTRAVIRDTQKIVQQARLGLKRMRGKRRKKVQGWVAQGERFVALTERVLQQTQARILEGNTRYPDKLFSLFDVETEAIRKGKMAKPTEFGKLVKIQEAENQIITDYEVYRQRRADQTLLMESIEKHKVLLGRAPQLVAADGGFYSGDNERDAQEAGVKKVAIPNRQTRSPTRRAHQKQRWFRRAQRWRVGSEGRISVLKRRHGLFRSRYKGTEGMDRWVGLGIVADNLISLGRLAAAR